MKIAFLSNRITALRSRFSAKFTLPERFKGTVVEKWAKYWTGLVNDYKDVALDVVKDVRQKPRKAALLGTIAYGLYACAQRNPDEEAFMQSLRTWNNQMVAVPTQLQNPKSAAHLRLLEQSVNHNKLRTYSLGICTLLWVDLYDKDDCTYRAICKHTGVNYTNFHQRLVDIGFWNHFWLLDWKMRNFDVNYL